MVKVRAKFRVPLESTSTFVFMKYVHPHRYETITKEGGTKTGGIMRNVRNRLVAKNH